MTAARLDDEGALHLGELFQLIETLEARLLQSLGGCRRSLVVSCRQGGLQDHLALQRRLRFCLIVHRFS